jgi:hypothetical protein
MRFCWQALAVGLVFTAIPSGAEPTFDGRLLQQARNSRPVIAVANEDKRQDPDTDILAGRSRSSRTSKAGPIL